MHVAQQIAIECTKMLYRDQDSLRLRTDKLLGGKQIPTDETKQRNSQGEPRFSEIYYLCALMGST